MSTAIWTTIWALVTAARDGVRTRLQLPPSMRACAVLHVWKAGERSWLWELRLPDGKSCRGSATDRAKACAEAQGELERNAISIERVAVVNARPSEVGRV